MDYFVGVDPDMHHTAIAVVDVDGQVVMVGMVKTKDCKEREAIVEMSHALADYFMADELPRNIHTLVVESQEISYTAKSGKNPRSVMMLANISGAVLAAAKVFYSIQGQDCRNVFLVPPAEWKGQVPKQIQQARTLQRLGWGFIKTGPKLTGYCYPEKVPTNVIGIENILQGEWKHVLDAIGIALWAHDSFIKDQAIELAKSAQFGVPAQGLDPSLQVPASVRAMEQEHANASKRRKKRSRQASKGPARRKPKRNRDRSGPGHDGSGGGKESPGGTDGGDPAVRQVDTPHPSGEGGTQPADQGTSPDPGPQGGQVPAVQTV